MNSKHHNPLFERVLGCVERDLLEQLSIGDLLVGFLLSGRSTKRMYATARARAAQRQTTQRSIERLIRKGYAAVGHNDVLHISQSGLASLERAVSTLRGKLHRREKWDGMWRLVSFDIPEREKTKRDVLRHVLKRAGFLQLQKSVWVHPFECEELQLLLEQDAHLASKVVYALVQKLSNERKMLELFRPTRK